MPFVSQVYYNFMLFVLQNYVIFLNWHTVVHCTLYYSYFVATIFLQELVRYNEEKKELTEVYALLMMNFSTV